MIRGRRTFDDELLHVSLWDGELLLDHAERHVRVRLRQLRERQLPHLGLIRRVAQTCRCEHSQSAFNSMACALALLA